MPPQTAFAPADLEKQKQVVQNPFKGKHLRSHDGFSDKEPLADYEVGVTLGEGGYGTVKRAHQKGAAQGVDVAVKIVSRSHLAATKNDVKEIKRRFEIMQSLAEHPHIVKLIDYRLTKTTLFAFYEYCRGKDLFDRILDRPNGRFTERQSQEATRALTDAIAYIHDRGLAHRDIKPENVLYRTLDGPYSDMVLADFGLSKELLPGEVIQGAAGSPGYWSPEMCQGKGYTSLADEWACAACHYFQNKLIQRRLGIVVYAMLSGRSPFKSLEADDLRKECAKGEISYPRKYWDSISDTAKDFVQKLLQADPEKRMTARDALSHKWLTDILPEEQAETEAEPAKKAEPEHAEERPGKLERRPTQGLTPAGASMRFDRPKDPIREESSDETNAVKSVTSPKVNGDRDYASRAISVVDTASVLRGNVSHDKLMLLAALDESQEATPIEGRSREPSQADLTHLAERFRDSGLGSSTEQQPEKK